MRLDKLVADAGMLTRSEARKLIKCKKVLVNEEVITDISAQVDENAHLLVNGKEVQYKKFIYLMLNKPAGVISATEDKNKKTVLDLIDPSYSRFNLSPVGRLDIDTVGFLLLTNDGALSHKLTSPSKNFGKTYFVRLEKSISDEDIKKLEDGVNIGDIITKKAKAERVSDNEILLTITEGKFHQIKRMAFSVDNAVIYLKRLSYGSVYLDENLSEGEYRSLTDFEINELYNVYKIN